MDPLPLPPCPPKSHRKTIPVLLLGSSAAARELLRLILSLRSLHRTMGITIRVVGVWYTVAFFAVKDLTKGFSDEEILYFSQYQDTVNYTGVLKLYDEKKQSRNFIPNMFKHPVEKFDGKRAQERVLSVARKLGPTGLIVVDAYETAAIFSLLNKLLSYGCSLVCGNAHPFTLSMDDFSALVRLPMKIKYDSTVAPGLHVIKCIRRLLATGQIVSQVTGSLGGYFGEVMDLVEQGVLFSEAVARVNHSNLATTVEGELDAIRRKAVIVGRSLGWKTALHDISIDPLLVSGIDELVLGKFKSAAEAGNAVRHVFKIDHLSAKIGLEEFPKNSLLGRSSGREQIVEITCREDSQLTISENFTSLAKSLLTEILEYGGR